MQRMCPAPLAVLWFHPGGHELETNLHQYFAIFRSHGEWFDFGGGDPVRHVREAVETRAWTMHKRTAGGSTPVDGNAECRVCEHLAGLHVSARGTSPRAGAPCRAVVWDDYACACSGLVSGKTMIPRQDANTFLPDWQQPNYLDTVRELVDQNPSVAVCDGGPGWHQVSLQKGTSTEHGTTG
uniref:GIY-YIG nuclease family protein n=1 Tax=Nonomuraea gerenzanensis TaxID=93944 RepID=UPI0037CAD512